MEIRNDPLGRPQAQPRAAETDPESPLLKGKTGEATREARTLRQEALARRDQVELSSTARELTAASDSDAVGADRMRAARIAELKARHEAGTLNSPEQIERAAARLLGDRNVD